MRASLSRRAAQNLGVALVAAGALGVTGLFLAADGERGGTRGGETASRSRAPGQLPPVEEELRAHAPGGASADEPLAGTESASSRDARDAADATSPDGSGPRSPGSAPGGSRARSTGATPGGNSPGTPSPRTGTAPGSRPAPNTTSSTPTTGTSSSPGSSAPDASNPDDPKGTGLTGQYLAFKSTLKSVPSLDGLKGVLTRLDPVIDFPRSADWSLATPALETFAACWRGFFKAPSAGHYTFVVGSHDGSVLEIDNKAVIDQNGVHAYAEGRAELDLAAGLHVLKLSFFIDLVDDADTKPVCRLLCALPGQGLGVVPTELLFPSSGPHAAQLPSLDAATPAGARRGQTVTLTGANFGPTTDTNAVTFGDANVPAVVQAASPTQLTVLVPSGVDAGPIKLSVGDQTAPALPYTVGGNFGLDALFYRETDDVDVTTFLDPRTDRSPDDERILGPITCSGPGAFGLAFPAIRFRAELYGQVYAAAAGEHGFGLECDAGARLLVDGQLVVDATKTPSHAEGKVTLAQGWHAVQIDYFTNKAGAKLNLLHADPGQPLAACPRALLAPPPAVDAQTPPVISAIDHPTPLHVGDTITIKGSGLALGDGRLPRVILRGTPLVVHAASPGQLSVEIFADALGGPLTVQVGPLVSDPVSLDVERNPNLLTRAAAITKLPQGVPAPVIDGKGDDLVWQTLPPLGAFVPCFQPGVGQYTTPLTQTWVTYDAQKLYVLVKCSEPQASGMTLVGKRHEDPIYTGDSIDLFFSTGVSPIPHAHLIVNPDNVTWTALVERPYDFSGSTVYDGDHSWNPTVATAAARSDGGWSIEMAIPWSALSMTCPQPGETHRVNIGRCRPAGPDYTCWSQTKQNFLEPDNFGTWTFR